MVLLPGCVCCSTRCGDLAWRLLQANSIEITLAGTDYDLAISGAVGRQIPCGFMQYYVCDPCGYPVGSPMYGREVFKGSLYSGTYSLQAASSSWYVNYSLALDETTRYYYYFFNSTPWICDPGSSQPDPDYRPSIQILSTIRKPLGSAISSSTVFLVDIKVTFIAFGRFTYNRAGSAAPAPSACGTSVVSCVATQNNNTQGGYDNNPLGYYSVFHQSPYRMSFVCNDSFSFDQVTSTNPVTSHAYGPGTTYSRVPGTPGDERGSDYIAWNSTNPTSASMTFSNLVVP